MHHTVAHPFEPPRARYLPGDLSLFALLLLSLLSLTLVILLLLLLLRAIGMSRVGQIFLAAPAGMNRVATLCPDKKKAAGAGERGVVNVGGAVGLRFARTGSAYLFGSAHRRRVPEGANPPQRALDVPPSHRSTKIENARSVCVWNKNKYCSTVYCTENIYII